MLHRVLSCVAARIRSAASWLLHVASWLWHVACRLLQCCEALNAATAAAGTAAGKSPKAKHYCVRYSKGSFPEKSTGTVVVDIASKSVRVPSAAALPQGCPSKAYGGLS